MKSVKGHAFYTGAFSAGGPVLRVKVLGKAETEGRYRVKVTSRKARAYKEGEEIEVYGHYLYDSIGRISPCRIWYEGQAWKEGIA